MKDLALLRLCADVMKKLADLLTEGEESIYERRQPVIAFMRRVESEGYVVDTETGTTVADGRDWSMLDAMDADARVVLAAEQITRAEQAGIYQQRLQRMHGAVDRIEAGYADRIRGLGLAVS
ncbi:hypothetical protein [Mycolicibacter sinensis]|uniref:hypothetical protein n=1 Tax=Mycolicibacter sinensis (strain JDM601) TaxID=875328 RepID=UPI0009EF6969|nr:hypothetical protein [Mycolicibacter sinensis]